MQIIILHLYFLCYDGWELERLRGMSAIINGMAVLMIYILFVSISYYALSKINWRKILHQRHAQIDKPLCILLSIAVGYLAGSFFITIIEILQQILLSIFL